MNYLEIEKVVGREIIDSRGGPTVEAEVVLADGTIGRGAVPSGAPTEGSEALELRDHENPRFGGKGVLKAVGNISIMISDTLKGMNAADIYTVNRTMIRTDGTKGKSNLGVNAILAVSITCVCAAASDLGLPLYRFLNGVNGNRLSVPMMDILNGGAYTANTVDMQEFMIMLVGAESFEEGPCWYVEVFHALAALLEEKKLVASVEDEGGFAPDSGSDEGAIQYILAAVTRIEYKPGTDFVLAMDAASSEWKGKAKGRYLPLKSEGKSTSKELVDRWEKLTGKYLAYSIEDGLDEEDWEGWRMTADRLGSRVQLAGDDLLVINTERLAKGISQGYGNSTLTKLSQTGTVSGTLKAIKIAHNAGYTAIASHHSGETEDTTIADLAAASNTCQIKTDAPNRSERVTKYNQLLWIEEELGESGAYPGMDTFHISR